jgi:RNA polymerase sigma factor (TIGR02999 family)
MLQTKGLLSRDGGPSQRPRTTAATDSRGPLLPPARSAFLADRTETAQLLLDTRAGSREAFDRLYGQVYEELRRIARQRLLQHRPGETLNTTALVHEAYLRLVDQTKAEWRDRAHFFALASRAMRCIVVDHARARSAQKRGGRSDDVPLQDVQVALGDSAADLLVLDEALHRLAQFSERLSRLVEYRFFGGLTFEEIAEITGCSTRTAKRDWQRARLWLFRFLQTT